MQTLKSGEKLIQSTSYSQTEIIGDIIKLYSPDGIECDCTYSTGGFYKNIPKPRLKFDKFPQLPDVMEACSTNLPLKTGEIKSLMYDPPFIAQHQVLGGEYKMNLRFGSIKGIENLLSEYEKSIKEFSRVIKNRGYLIIKCQDLTYGGRNYFNHITIHDFAIKYGFKAVDLFVLLSKTRIISMTNQFHARKFHCYFWVFKLSKVHSKTLLQGDKENTNKQNINKPKLSLRELSITIRNMPL